MGDETQLIGGRDAYYRLERLECKLEEVCLELVALRTLPLPD